MAPTLDGEEQEPLFPPRALGFRSLPGRVCESSRRSEDLRLRAAGAQGEGGDGERGELFPFILWCCFL